MEDDLKILEVEYLSNHVLDNTQILSLSVDYQPYFTNSSPTTPTLHGKVYFLLYIYQVE